LQLIRLSCFVSRRIDQSTRHTHGQRPHVDSAGRLLIRNDHNITVSEMASAPDVPTLRPSGQSRIQHSTNTVMSSRIARSLSVSAPGISATYPIGAASVSIRHPRAAPTVAVTGSRFLTTLELPKSKLWFLPQPALDSCSSERECSCTLSVCAISQLSSNYLCRRR
jgi:hypothetical protein